MPTTKTFRISGIASLVSVALLLAGRSGVEAFTVLGVLLACFAWPVFFFSAARLVFRRLLWRVGSRLLVSYLLIGVVPLPFLAGLAYLGTFVLAGQLAGRRVKAELMKRDDALAAASKELAGGLPADAAARRLRIASAAHAAGASWAFAPEGGPPEGGGPLPPADLAKQPPADAAAGLLGEHLFLARVARPQAGTLVLYLPLDQALAAALERDTGIAVFFTNVHVESKGLSSRPRKGVVLQGSKGEDLNVDVDELGAGAPRRPRPPVPGPSGPIRGRWVAWLAVVEHPVFNWETGTVIEGIRATAVVRSSIARELDELFLGARLGSGRVETGLIVLRIMQGLAALTAGVYLVAALLAGFLVLRIARATHRLTAAFRELGEGRFGVRAELKGHDQLAELVAGFNRMSQHLAVAVSERAAQESLRHELDLARDLQRRLLPPADFVFEGVEIAADFRPAAEVGGDFYHLAKEADRTLAVAIADVSGHGLATGIVMASAKASLSALHAAGTPATDLFAALDRELFATTEARTFVTLVFARFRLADRAVDVTNAGHIYPYRVTAEGAVSSVDLPSRPLGLALSPRWGPSAAPVFRSATAAAEPGDLWVFLSDGVVEATSPAGEEFGFARLEALLATCGGCAAAEVSARVLDAWRTHTSRDVPEDDRTLLVLRLLPLLNDLVQSRQRIR